ncbi:unnamed protein product [Closterium sp. Naga37s-1]|nr:unnamed protein product [Closterium sp. Naga37s-1]
MNERNRGSGSWTRDDGETRSGGRRGDGGRAASWRRSNGGGPSLPHALTLTCPGGAASSVVRGAASSVVRGAASSVVRGAASSVVRGAASSVVRGAASSVVRGAASSVVRGAASSVVRGAASSVVRGAASSVVRGAASSVVRGAASSVVRGGASSVVRGAASSVVRGGASSVVRGAASSVVRGAASSVVRGAASSVVRGAASSVVRGAASSVIMEEAQRRGRRSDGGAQRRGRRSDGVLSTHAPPQMMEEDVESAIRDGGAWGRSAASVQLYTWLLSHPSSSDRLNRPIPPPSVTVLQLLDYLRSRMLAIVPNLTALKAKHDTPKNGLVFHAALSSSATRPPRSPKGRISRVLAPKSSLATRWTPGVMPPNLPWRLRGALRWVEGEEKEPSGIDGMHSSSATASGAAICSWCFWCCHPYPWAQLPFARHPSSAPTVRPLLVLPSAPIEQRLRQLEGRVLGSASAASKGKAKLRLYDKDRKEGAGGWITPAKSPTTDTAAAGEESSKGAKEENKDKGNRKATPSAAACVDADGPEPPSTEVCSGAFIHGSCKAAFSFTCKCIHLVLIHLLHSVLRASASIWC